MKIFSCFKWSIVFGGILVANIVSAKCPPLLDHVARKLADTQTDHLCKVYENHVVMIVNTASKCGYTPQFEALESLYQKYKNEDFTILGFPSKDFGSQEFEAEEATADFCRLTYGVQFPMYSYTRAKKGVASPLFVGLAEAAGDVYPNWNFHKYVVGRDGDLIGSLGASAGPKQLERLILKGLQN